jgi:hypothetical protein
LKNALAYHSAGVVNSKIVGLAIGDSFNELAVPKLQNLKQPPPWHLKSSKQATDLNSNFGQCFTIYVFTCNDKDEVFQNSILKPYLSDG